ncbi:MAG: DUF433 domain-containing protein, partial [Candidatus Tectomicrobia bacterium]|nr:DUF433 domain-containing protein [Candidatus Tectomicrobia bacterium]
QQCVEKYLKALLVLQGIDFPKTHDLEKLVSLLPGEVHTSLTTEEQAMLTEYSLPYTFSRKVLRLAGKSRVSGFNDRDPNPIPKRLAVRGSPGQNGGKCPVVKFGGQNMTDQKLLKRITVRPEVFGGKPIVRNMRISVELILSLLAQGVTPEAILEDYPDLELDDIRACIAYAHAVIAHDTLDAVSVIEP